MPQTSPAVPPAPEEARSPSDWSRSTLRVGWASTDLTPSEPVVITGQFHARVSEGVHDPVTATAMAFESLRPGDAASRGVMVSCDLVSIPNSLRDAVHGHLRRDLPELDAELVFLNATHTHTGPEIRLPSDAEHTGGGNVPHRFGVELDVMPPEAYAAMIARRIADAVIQAWRGRQPAAIGYGLGQATVGYNRRIAYFNGTSRMYGNPNDPEFSHIEGAADNSVNVVGIWDRADQLLGVVVNLACPSQISGNGWQISADFWHETRQELRRRLGEGLFILPQVSAAGDQHPAQRHTMIGWAAQVRMWQLMGIDQRQDTANRIADAVTSVLPYAHKDLQHDPVVVHRAETIELPRRMLSEQDVQDAQAEAAKWQAEYETLGQDLEANPQKRQEPRWFQKITGAYRRMQWNQAVAKRHAHQGPHSKQAVTVHVLRLGDLAIATNPFEYYLDFGHQIRARSRAVQTLLIQLAGSGTYVPTQRAAEGGGYSAVPASTPVGPEGGRVLADWTVAAINAMWPEEPTAQSAGMESAEPFQGTKRSAALS